MVGGSHLVRMRSGPPTDHLHRRAWKDAAMKTLSATRTTGHSIVAIGALMAALLIGGCGGGSATTSPSPAKSDDDAALTEHKDNPTRFDDTAVGEHKDNPT